MLNIPTPFPHPGSTALLGDITVRIMRAEPDGRRFVTGAGVTRTVELSQLSDAATPADPVSAWIDDRVIFDAGDRRTAFGDLYDDFAAWCALRGIAHRDLPTRLRLGIALVERGARTFIVRRCNYRTERAMSVALKGDAA